MKKQMLFVVKIIAVAAILSSCTKTRKAELSEDQVNNVFAISEFGQTTENSQYGILTPVLPKENTSNSLQAIPTESKGIISANEVSVPSRMKFMFEGLPLLNLQVRDFKITFSVDREYVTVFKIVRDMNTLSILEKALAVTTKEVQLINQLGKSGSAQVQSLTDEKIKAALERDEIKTGVKAGVLLVPLFKYKVEEYGTVVRSKNELKEETARLELKSTDWQQATHIRLSAQVDKRLVVGAGTSQKKQLKQIFSENRIDNQIMTAEELQNRLSIGMKFIEPSTKIFTRLDASVMRVYEITGISSLNETQLRLLKNKAGNQQILACSDETVAAFIKSTDASCVIVLKANVPVSYKRAKLTEVNEIGNLSQDIEFEDVHRSKSTGLVEIKENVTASQADISGTLDPSSSIKLSDIKGEFLYRRTFESASNMFLGRTGTSGDMAIIRFEIEDDRIVVRNQKSLIEYTGQGPKDREELMSFPVKYVRMVLTDAAGSKLTVPVAEATTKEKAEYALIDWTKNTVPDAVSPLAFYSGGRCFMANSALVVSDTDMRLATDGVLNYSLSGSYTVNPTDKCVSSSDANSAYWKGSAQFNFNVTERISFMKHKNPDSDKQIAANISSMAQAAFNYGVFTLADKVNGNGTLANRDGSEKYMPMIHDFRNGKKLVYHLGGINNPEATNPERRQLLVDAAKQVIAEWNLTLKYAFDGTALERKKADYVELIVDETDTGHLGDLDRNYIWLQELPAENGLLGVAQPAANPRSGTILASNVIVYTGNTFNQTEALLQISKVSREYEKAVEKIKTQAVEEIAKQKKAAEPAAPADAPAGAEKIRAQADRLNANLTQTIAALQIDNKEIQKALNGMKKSKNPAALKRVLSKDLFKNFSKGQTINYEVSSETFLKKLADIAVEKRAATNPYEFELEANKAFIQFGNLGAKVKLALQKRSEMLDAAIRFDKNMKNRPGCFTYERADINDQAAVMDEDPRINLLKNFKKNVMSTLSHELGHAFGLLHNFKASTDKANYEFKNEKTGRNYSSIMDYLADIDMNYAGPGPYDEHAIRAAYTGLVEVSEEGLKNDDFKRAVKINRANLVSIEDIIAAQGSSSSVHLTKDTLNLQGVLKYYEQCDDTQIETSAMCAMFDAGGSATEIVKNLIADYHRGFINRNFVHDKIMFSSEQKMAIINRNIALFQNIRSFLDEAVTNIIMGTGLPEAQGGALIEDLVTAAKMGYKFFHEVLRTPNAPGASIMRKVVVYDKDQPADSEENVQAKIDEENDTNKDGFVVNSERFMAAPYKYKNDNGEEVEDVKIIEARSLYDISLDEDSARDKFESIGIGFDKVFAMMFLLQSTAAETSDDSRESNISYIDFEQWFMDIEDPTESPIMNTMLEILTKKLKVGFFKPSDDVSDSEIIMINAPVTVNKSLMDQTAVGTVIGLAQNKWKGFDAFAEMFKVSKATQAQAPKDRVNVAKAGQDRALSDTKVLFASQNAVASNILVQIAARNELFNRLEEALFKTMQQIYMADSAYRKPIAKIKAEACAKGKDTPECQAANKKTLAEYLNEDPALAKAKEEADKVAKDLVDNLRKLNANNLIMPAEMDAEDAPMNFVRQVESLRNLLASQIDLLSNVKALLEQTPAKQLDATFAMIGKVLAGAQKKNKSIEEVHLLAMGLTFVSKVASQIEIELKTGQTVKGSMIAKMFLTADKVKTDLQQQLEVIEKLSKFSGVVDPDTVIR